MRQTDRDRGQVTINEEGEEGKTKMEDPKTRAISNDKKQAPF